MEHLFVPEYATIEGSQDANSGGGKRDEDFEKCFESAMKLRKKLSFAVGSRESDVWLDEMLFLVAHSVRSW